MHRSRLLLVASAAIAAISLALPFVRFAERGSVNGIDGYAWPGAAVLGVLALFAVAGDRAESLHPSVVIGAIALAGSAIVLAAFKLADAAKAADIADASVGAGPWVLLAASVLGMGGALASLTRKI